MRPVVAAERLERQRRRDRLAVERAGTAATTSNVVSVDDDDDRVRVVVGEQVEEVLDRRCPGSGRPAKPDGGMPVDGILVGVEEDVARRPGRSGSTALKSSAIDNDRRAVGAGADRRRRRPAPLASPIGSVMIVVRLAGSDVGRVTGRGNGLGQRLAVPARLVGDRDRRLAAVAAAVDALVALARLPVERRAAAVGRGDRMASGRPEVDARVDRRSGRPRPIGAREAEVTDRRRRRRRRSRSAVPSSYRSPERRHVV